MRERAMRFLLLALSQNPSPPAANFGRRLVSNSSSSSHSRRRPSFNLRNAGRGGRTALSSFPSSSSSAGSTSSGDDEMNLFLQSKNVQLPTSCPGCGTALQRADKNLPGFYVVPSKLLEEETEGEDVDEEEYTKLLKEGKKEKKKKKTPEDWSQLSPDELARRIMAENSSVHDGGGGEESEDDFDFEDVTFVKDDEIEDEDEDGKEAIDAFESLFFEKDDGKEIDEDYELEMAALKKMNRLKRKPPAIVCARCFSLRNTGRPKNVNAEILLPSFDFKRSVGTQMERYPNNSKKGVVLVVVDLVDFDGSFPVDAVDALEPHAERGAIDIVLVANKVDLMPAQATRARLTQFVRRRAKAFGMQSASEVLLASATAGMGIRVLSDELEDILRNRGGHKKKDVYVVGAQNAGKSSLLAAMTRAKPKVASYPFTTIDPNLGVSRYHEKEITLADIPGLIEGAHNGVGLGDKFLRHIERCKILLHLIDLSEEDIVGNYLKVRDELSKYNKVLTEKIEIIVFNKSDLFSEKELQEKLKDFKNKIKKKYEIISVFKDNKLINIKKILLKNVHK